MDKKTPTLYIVIPCYNEQEVLPITAPMFKEKIISLREKGEISSRSRVMFVDDGSRDKTWEIISEFAKTEPQVFCGIRQSRNRGHQNAVLAGLFEAMPLCDITISIDCDGQDDINAIDEMVSKYKDGCEIVYGVRSERKTDSVFKRSTAQAFYKLMNAMGAEVIYNHADYRLISSMALKELFEFNEVNLFLRGMVPLVGFKSDKVYYARAKRLAGESHYPFKKMLALAINGITSLSVKPLRLITVFGIIISLLSFLGVLWVITTRLLGNTVEGWASMTAIICFVSGVQLMSLGVIGEYVGKCYMESKRRPRFIISERTNKARENEDN